MAWNLQSLRERGEVGHLSNVRPHELQPFYIWANQFVLARSTLFNPSASDVWKGPGFVKTKYIEAAERLENADQVLSCFEESDLEEFLKQFNLKQIANEPRVIKQKLVYAACLAVQGGAFEVVPGE